MLWWNHPPSYIQLTESQILQAWIRLKLLLSCRPGKLFVTFYTTSSSRVIKSTFESWMSKIWPKDLRPENKLTERLSLCRNTWAAFALRSFTSCRRFPVSSNACSAVCSAWLTLNSVLTFSLTACTHNTVAIWLQPTTSPPVADFCSR